MVIEAVTACRIIGSMNPITVDLTRRNFRQIHVPNLVRVLGQWDPNGLTLGFRRIKQTQLDPSGVFAVKREVDAAPVPCRPERIGLPGRTRRMPSGAPVRCS
jgi:hypothetical protein